MTRAVGYIFHAKYAGYQRRNALFIQVWHAYSIGSFMGDGKTVYVGQQANSYQR